MNISNRLPPKILAQITVNQNAPISDKAKVTIQCQCGKEVTIGARSLVRRWEKETAYRCKSCDIKTYASDPTRIKKFQKSISKTTNTPEFKTKMSAQGKATWASPEARKTITEAVRQDNKTNPKKKEARAKALAALKSKTWFKEHMNQIRISQDKKPSNIEKLTHAFLDSLNIHYVIEKQVGFYSFDCFIPSHNLLIECQGDYWHSQTKTIRTDKGKNTYIKKYFPEYEIMYLWEHEFYAKERVLDRLKLKLGIDIETIDFSFNTVSIRGIEKNELKPFLDSYHYLSANKSGHTFGVFLEDKLIACCVYSNPIRQNISQQFGTKVIELSRFCIHPLYHKKNFASWFLSRTIKQIKEPIIAYADTTVGHTGTIYKASNFKLHHVVPADYWYVDCDGYVMHKKTLWDRASKMSMKESQFAEQLGYYKKYGLEKLCFVYNQK